MSEFDELEQKQLRSPDRRIVLRAALGGAALLPAILAAPAFAAEAAGALNVSPLPGGLTLISGAGTNVVCAAGPKGALMVDGGVAARTDEVVREVLARTKTKQVATLFNTCWRLEQTGANDKLGAAGAKIVAHENTKLWMGAEIDARWENKVYPPRAPAARPTQTFSGPSARASVV